MAQESFASIAKRRLLGLAFIVVLFALVSLSVAFYNKAFTDVVTVTLRTDHTGNQLLTQSDVKERGIIVGSVRKVKSVGDGAIVTLALQPSRVKEIPNNVSAQILPKTLFGEQYVSLTLPDQAGPPIKGGDTIGQDRSAVALESQKVLGDMLPLLQAVEPAELQATLRAMATALRGRGEKLGQTLVAMDDYLKHLNADASPGKTYVTQMVEDLDKLGRLSDDLNAAAPDLLATLDNFQTGAKTVIDKQAALDTLLTTATSTSGIIESFLAENKQRLITVVDTSQSIYSLLSEYTPEYTCMLNGLVELDKRAKTGIQHSQIQLSAQLYIAPPNFGAYVPGNEPRYITGLGPNCAGLPNPPVPYKIPADQRCINDGAALTPDPCGQSAAATSGYDQQAIGSPAEDALVNSLIAGTYGTTPDEVPPIATMLAAPALRGAEVTVK
jgi:phospholipid/cholesterol/gamma-HCH transport system substrate-binding protein